jgi:AraC-like DNA-binding protein
VRCIWRLTAPASIGLAAEPILPDGCVELVVNLADPFIRQTADGASEVQPLHLIAGQLTRAVRISPSGRVDLWGIRFHPWSAASFFGVSGNELRDAMLPMHDVAIAFERALLSAIHGVHSHAIRDRLVCALTEQMTRVRSSLGARRLHSVLVDEKIARLVQLATTSREPLSVRELAREGGWSERRVQLVFRDAVGLAPKQLIRITRFQRALALRRANDSVSWAPIAARAGYHDQAHLIHESQQIAGCTPVELLRVDAGFTETFLTD